ncbi:MAG TPA: hypothetical protein VGQ57_14580 [Polyangiaceae bacterium]|jgi:hypothetical protein|nr:hypothetical protein [Polyangiaceae bacterium]
MPPRLPCLFGIACAAALASATAPARAEDDDYRRPGLEGQWSRRHLTAPMNSLRIIAGPGQPMLFGERFGNQIADGGVQVIRDPETDTGAASKETEVWLRGGVGFGLTEDWEAGALFLPFQFAPHFAFSNITVFITRGFRFEHWDIGIRYSFQTPHKDSGGGRVWDMNPGIPLLYRAERVRLDTALFVPFATRDWWIGLNIPARVSVSVSPHFFVGAESGFVVRRFEDPHGVTIPLGGLIGYTELFGSRVVDFTGMFSWDSFYRPNPPNGADPVAAGAYRVGLGVVLHSLVR